MALIVPKDGFCFVDPDYRFPKGVPVAAQKLALVEVDGFYAIRIETDDLGRTVYSATDPSFRSVSSDQCRLVGYVVGIPENSYVSVPNN